jgi:hypothetical protein
MMQTVTGEFYLAVKKNRHTWKGLSARLTNKAPALDSGEVAIRVTVTVPDALFTRPILQASINVPEVAVSKPVIDATVLDNIKESLTQQFGLDVRVALVENDRES